MSRGRPRHQASRRRMYSGRQRELRERKVRAEPEDQPWLSDSVAGPDTEDAVEYEAPASWTVPLSGRASAA